MLCVVPLQVVSIVSLMTQSYLVLDADVETLTASPENIELLVKLLASSNSLDNTDVEDRNFSTYEVTQVSVFLHCGPTRPSKKVDFDLIYTIW